MSRSLFCPPSHGDGTATCPGSSVRLDPQSGRIDTHAFVETANKGMSVEWSANDTDTGIVTARVWLARATQTARVTVSYLLPASPSTQTSPANSAYNSLDGAAQMPGCRDCAGDASVALADGTAAGTRGVLTLDITNTAGAAVPAGWVTVSIDTVSFATIGTCNVPCGQPGSGTASASASTQIVRVSIAPVA
jgi:hypothetical protein